MPDSAKYKVIMIGDCRVGKTSFLQELMGKNNSRCSLSPTIGVEFTPTRMMVNGQETQLNIWDTSGAERYRAITSSYYRKCQGAILMFDMTERPSFLSLSHWIEEVNQRTGSSFSKLIVGNKCDLYQTGESQRQVGQEELTAFCTQHGVSFRLVSALSGENVKESVRDLVEKIQESEGFLSADYGSDHQNLDNISIANDRNDKPAPPSNTCARCC